MGGKKAFELMLEIGHKSQPLKSKLPNGYTHKWTVFVRGANNSKIEHCIQRVVFQLHDSFANPHREITEPPYQVKETGYAGFEIPIEIYFKNREKPNHVVFTLDLCLLLDRPHNSSMSEKVKFYNPNREFEKCLIKTGAKMLPITKDKKERSDSPPAKKQKSSSLIPSKDMSKQASLAQPHSQTTNHSQSSSSHHHTSSQHHHQSKSSQPNHSHNHSYHNHSSNNNSSSNNNNNNNNNVSNSLFQNHTSHQNHNTSNNNHHHHHNNHHQSSTKPSSQQQQSSLPKPKSSKEFIDVFGAPIVYNNNKSHQSNSKEDATFSTKASPPLPVPRISHQQPQQTVAQSHNKSQSSLPRSLNKHQQAKPTEPQQQSKSAEPPHQVKPVESHKPVKPTESQKHVKPAESQKHVKPIEPQKHVKSVEPQKQVKSIEPQKQAKSIVPQKQIKPIEPQKTQPQPPIAQPAQAQTLASQTDTLQVIQTKISSLSDCDRLQKIVDIIEESGEWYNLTPNKFEFDLKRLDKKTLNRIEKCLP